jgi:hydrogenase nickel incorporation protein HypA/HybF
MHELSIAQEVVDLAGEHLLRSGAARAVSVTLRVGALSGVVAPALQTAFRAAAAGSPVDGARLVIEEVPAAVFCDVCNEERELESVQSRRCPVCQTPANEIIRGADLELAAIEVEDTAAPTPSPPRGERE